jgi:hypothetical protein
VECKSCGGAGTVLTTHTTTPLFNPHQSYNTKHLAKKDKCITCEGSGKVPYDYWVVHKFPCLNCYNSGGVLETAQDYTMGQKIVVQRQCDDCRGVGFRYSKESFYSWEAFKESTKSQGDKEEFIGSFKGVPVYYKKLEESTPAPQAPSPLKDMSLHWKKVFDQMDVAALYIHQNHAKKPYICPDCGSNLWATEYGLICTKHPATNCKKMYTNVHKDRTILGTYSPQGKFLKISAADHAKQAIADLIMDSYWKEFIIISEAVVVSVDQKGTENTDKYCLMVPDKENGNKTHVLVGSFNSYKEIGEYLLLTLLSNKKPFTPVHTALPE